MTTELDQITILTGLIGGLALFLFGMNIMTSALKKVAGNSMKAILSRMTGSRLRGLLAGATVTAIVQSSSVTTVLLIGFISAGLMTTAQSVAVILGANIGTTITAQILAFKVTGLALPMLALGFFISVLAKRNRTRAYGKMLLGLGLVFFGMATMSDAMKPLRSFQPFLDFMLSLDNVALAALVAAGFTALVQSSSATTGILIVMAGQGLIALEPAVAMALGANIGTCITALLAALGKPREALRAALVHTLFNVCGVLIWIGFVDELADLARAISPLDAETAASAIPRQLANVHTLFNVINAALFIGFTTQLSRFVEWLVPDRPEPVEPASAPRHLDPEFLGVPAFAVEAVRLETLHLGHLVKDMLSEAVPTVVTGSPLAVDQLRVMDRPVDLLHRAIVGYMRKMPIAELPRAHASQLVTLLKIANDFEHIGDLVATGLVTSARKRIEEQVVISPATAGIITELHAAVIEALEGILQALSAQDPNIAREVRKMEANFADLVEEIAAHEITRLYADEPKRLHTYTREIELTQTFEDIFKILRRIATNEVRLFRDPKAATAA